jgi:hypothetical protein
MAVDSTTYLGPYVECRLGKKDAVDPDEVLELLDEALFPPLGDSFRFWMQDHNTHLWLSNLDIPGQKRDFSFYPDADIQLMPITPQLIDEEIARFTKRYKKELSVLREKYGAKNVEVKWGLIHEIH